MAVRTKNENLLLLVYYYDYTRNTKIKRIIYQSNIFAIIISIILNDFQFVTNRGSCFYHFFFAFLFQRHLYNLYGTASCGGASNILNTIIFHKNCIES